MVALHIRVHIDGDTSKIEVDRLLREDASKRECAVVDILHDILKASFEKSPARVGPVVEIAPRTEGGGAC